MKLALPADNVSLTYSLGSFTFVPNEEEILFKESNSIMTKEHDPAVTEFPLEGGKQLSIPSTFHPTKLTMGNLIQVDDHKWAVLSGGKPKADWLSLADSLLPSTTRPCSSADLPRMQLLSRQGVPSYHINSPKVETSTNS